MIRSNPEELIRKNIARFVDDGNHSRSPGAGQKGRIPERDISKVGANGDFRNSLSAQQRWRGRQYDLVLHHLRRDCPRARERCLHYRNAMFDGHEFSVSSRNR